MMAQPPSEYQTIPEKIRNGATVVFTGIYFTANGPRQKLPDGTVRWRMIAGFRLLDDFSGNIANEVVEIEPFGKPMKVKNEWVKTRLQEGESYLVLLKPQPESMAVIGDKEKKFSHLNLVTRQEVLAVVKITAKK